ncbi:MAG: peptidylprolyl isomerase [Fidelibacterota bacterium]
MKRYLLLGILSMFALQCTQKEEEMAVISTKFGDMVVAFFPEVAPKHVESFKVLAKEGYFDGTTFHRVIPGFVIQGGDPNSRDEDRTNDGMGGRAGKYFGLGDEQDSATWTIPAEFNDSLHVRGTLSMARSQDPNSASSQFFICVDALPRLDHKYTVFGKVIQGLEVIDSIVAVPTPRKKDPFYRGIDGDNPLEKVEMTVRILPRSQALATES